MNVILIKQNKLSQSQLLKFKKILENANKDTFLRNNADKNSITEAIDFLQQYKPGTARTWEIKEPNVVLDNELIKDDGVRFLKEIKGEDFIGYKELSDYFNIKEGTLNTNCNDWLMVSIDGKELIISKQNICTNISWDFLDSKGLVDGNSTEPLIVNGVPYRLRLLKGIYGNYSKHGESPEWNKLFLPLVKKYSHEELDLVYSASWCQEGHDADASYRVLRGHLGPSRLSWNTSSAVNTSHGWRACLELIP